MFVSSHIKCIVFGLIVVTLSLSANTNSSLNITAGHIKKDKAYHTCRYETIKLLSRLEEFDSVKAKVTFARLKKHGNTYKVYCKFSNLIGKRGILKFPIKQINFKYHKRAFDFIIDGKAPNNWITYIGILHSG